MLGQHFIQCALALRANRAGHAPASCGVSIQLPINADLVGISRGLTKPQPHSYAMAT